VVTDSSLITGIAWYRRDQWTRLRNSAADADKLEESYDDWLAGAQNTLIQMTGTGVPAQRVDVDVDALVGWCQVEGRRLDSAARAAYAALQLRRAQQGRAHQRSSPERTV
jgi:hypothetical protein